MKPDFSIECSYLERDHLSVIAGVDEAGRGPWSGPVVAAAVILNKSDYPEGLNDSKKLSKLKRELIYKELIEISDFGVGVVNEPVIDQINILEATKLAMRTAVGNLARVPNVVLVDGNHKFDTANKEMEIIPVIKGDSKSLSIAAASIIAKVTRDMFMEDIDSEYPVYGWAKNAGYGTKEHSEAIEKYGITKYHRKSFAPIKRYLAKNA